MRAYRTVVSKTRESLPDALIVLVGPYWNLQYDTETWSDPKYERWFGKFNRAGVFLVLKYNAAIEELASETGALFVDVYHLLEGATWLLTDDACHFNDVGQHIIGLSVFMQVAAHCSFPAGTSRRMEKELGANISNTGGTDALPHVIQTWRNVERWKK